MTTIGFYKPHKPLFFNFNHKQNNYGGNLENINLLKILAEHGHQIYIFSKTDYNKYKTIKNIQACDIRDVNILLISNGIFNSDIYRETELLNRFKNSKKILLETDLYLSKKYHNSNLYDLILTQMPDTGKRKYAHLEKLIIYKHNIYCNNFNSRKKQGVFMGGERDRLNKFSEYIIRPNIYCFGKSKTFNINNKINQIEINKKLKTYLYSIVMSGDEQNKNGFISQRYFENSLHGVVNFCDIDYDKNELIIKKDDWRRVNNYVELFQKIKSLNDKTFKILQQNQFQEIKQWRNGEKLYNHIYNLIK